MNPIIKDLLQSFFWVVGIAGGITTAWVAISQLKANTQQRQRELRFNQAKEGKRVLEELFSDKEANRALEMLDFEYNYFPSDAGDLILVNERDIPEALNYAFDRENSKNLLIAKSFDALFYSLSSMEHFINIQLITEEDIRHPMDYYADKLARNKLVYINYIQRTTYSKSLQFLDRFPIWRQTVI